MSSHKPTRRGFLQHSLGAAAAAGTVPYFWSSAYAKGEDRRTIDPTSPRLAWEGWGVATGEVLPASATWSPVPTSIVITARSSRPTRDFKGRCEVYTDYRKILERDDIEVVLIGTPDHWHSKIVIDALKAGKDVQCQKPLTLTIDEGKQICKVVKETSKILHIGTQQRSEYQSMFLKSRRPGSEWTARVRN